MAERSVPLYKRGDLLMIDLGAGFGSEQGGQRPAIVVQNNVGNKFAPTLIIVPLTKVLTKKNIPTHVFISKEDVKIDYDSIALCEQIETIDKKRVLYKMDTVSEEIMKKIDAAIKISIGLISEYN